MFKRKHIERILFTVLLLMLFIFGTVEKKASAETGSNISDIVDLTGIMRDSDGSSVISNKYATRESFAQMLVQASPYVGEVGSTNTLRLFQDVPKNSEKAAYIQIAVSKGYMSGYLNGLFKPEKAITLKEAVYSSLALLGYTKEDFTGKLSEARYDKFKELGLNKNLTATENNKLTKKDCENLFYNLLNAKQKTGEIYGKALGYTYNDDGEINYQSLLEKKTKGPYLIKNNWEDMLSSELSAYTIIQNDKEIKATEIIDSGIVYYAEQSKRIWIYTEKVYGTLENITYSQGEPQDVTIAGTVYTVEKPTDMRKIIKAADLQKGTLVVLYKGRDNKAAYLSSIKTTIAEGNWKEQLAFKLSKATISKNDTKAAATDIESYDVIYYSNELKEIWAFNKKIYGSLDSITTSQGEPQEFTVSGKSYFVENPLSMKKEVKSLSIQTSMPVVLLFGWDNKVHKILPLASMVAENNWELAIATAIDQCTFYKNGSKVTHNDISNQDVIYYSKELKTVWAYEKKAYGVVQSVTPNISSPEAIVVAGKTYDLTVLPVGTSSDEANAENLTENIWGKRLQEKGIQVGDNVVVLFGYNGKVADICTVEKMTVTIAGYVLSVDNKLISNDQSINNVSRIIRIVDTEGIVREFPCSDISISKGCTVEINFKNGNPVITLISSSTNTIPTNITSKKFNKDARIIEVKNQNYVKKTVDELSEVTWNLGNVLYYKINSMDEITDLILYNTTESFYQYGLLKKSTYTGSEGSVSFLLTFDFGGGETSISVDNGVWNYNSGPKAVLIEDNTVKDIKELKEVRISYISEKQANTGEAVYRIADDVIVYFLKSGEYYEGKLEDITDFSNYRVNGYVGQAQGLIKVIVVAN